MIEIAPSILSADFARLGEDIKAAERGGAGLIHMDVMDGHFVPNITIGPLVVRAARRVTDLPLDCHLMITDPDRYIEEFARDRFGAASRTGDRVGVLGKHRQCLETFERGHRPGLELQVDRFDIAQL